MVASLVIPFVVVVRDELAPGRPEERVAVMEEDPEVSQASVLGLGGVPHELGDLRPVGLGADARDLTAAAGQVHQDQHGEAGQAAWRPARDGHDEELQYVGKRRQTGRASSVESARRTASIGFLDSTGSRKLIATWAVPIIAVSRSPMRAMSVQGLSAIKVSRTR